MTYWEIERAARRFYPAIAFDGLFPRTSRIRVLKLLWFLTLLFGLVALPSIFADAPAWVSSNLWSIVLFSRGFFFLTLPFSLLVFAFHSFVNSFFFRGFEQTIPEHFSPTDAYISYEIATFCFSADPRDITDGFLRFSFGRMIMARAGVDQNVLEQFRAVRTNRLSVEQLAFTPSNADGKMRLFDIAMAVFTLDAEFKDFLFKQGIQEKGFRDAAAWVSRDVLSYKKHMRWWSRDALGRIEGIAKDWSYGTAFRLRRYANDLTRLELPSLSSKPKYVQENVERIEAILSKAREANVLLVGEDGGSKKDVLYGFASIVKEGQVFPQLEHKKVYVFDSNRIISGTAEKTKFESEFIQLLDESVNAGNVIMVFEDFPAFLQSALQLGSNAVGLLSPYLNSSAIQFICLSSPTPFHQLIESDGMLTAKFDTILLKEGESLDVLQTLQDEASVIERRQGLTIPQPTLGLIIESADRYVTEGIMPDKAIDLLYEIAGQSSQQGKKEITRADVLDFVRTKTGIPTGTVGVDEQQKLINLEQVLHQRVVGQDEAVSAIANAMRRSRAGVANPSRPMGSFLFMGPTGVGKTETTKALASTFFNDENKILRLDMSEYTSPDSLSKLIGSFQTNTAGVLSSMLREHPYGVLLLDEFEKTTKEVMDLFLQILDEGMFSDMRGKKVNARNLIIIATSNAGSDLIWQYMQQGAKLNEKKDEIVDAVVKQGIFRPELLNRFDGVILFHPIGDAHLRDIARMMLEKFRSRIRARGIDLDITDDLITYLMKFGNDPKFGARPMNRAIQDIVEQKIADKIIKGDIKLGEKVQLIAADLQ